MNLPVKIAVASRNDLWTVVPEQRHANAEDALDKINNAAENKMTLRINN